MCKRAEAAIGRLKADIRAALEDYHRLEITLVLQAMRDRYADCELEVRKYRDLSDQAQAIQARLKRPARALGWLLLRPGPSRDERQRLQRRLRRIEERLNRSYTFVEEREVRQWLNTLVDAGLGLTPEQWHRETQEARFLFYQLLNTNRLQAIMPAKRLVATVFSRHEADGSDGIAAVRATMFTEYRSRTPSG